MMARLNRVIVDTTTTDVSSSSSRSHVNFYEAREEEDPLPDQSLIDPVDANQHDYIDNAIQSIIEKSSDNGLNNEETTALTELVNEFKNIFRTSFSSGPPVKFAIIIIL